jgi:hypothetical protein
VFAIVPLRSSEGETLRLRIPFPLGEGVIPRDTHGNVASKNRGTPVVFGRTQTKRRGRPEGRLFKEASIDPSPDRGVRSGTSASKCVLVVVALCFLIASESHALAFMVPDSGKTIDVTVAEKIVVKYLTVQEQALWSSVPFQEKFVFSVGFERQLRPHLQRLAAVINREHLPDICPLKQRPSVSRWLFQSLAILANHGTVPNDRRPQPIVCQSISNSKRRQTVNRYSDQRETSRGQMRFASLNNRSLRNICLAIDSAQGSQCQNCSDQSKSSQNPIGPSGRGEGDIYYLFHLVFGAICVLAGARLAWMGGYDPREYGGDGWIAVTTALMIVGVVAIMH